MTEQDRTTQLENKKVKSWGHYFRLGVTIFLTVAACIVFYFTLYRWEDISVMLNTIIKSAEPIIIGLVLAYLMMPVKDFIEKPMYKLLINKKLKEESAKNIARAISITGAIIFLFIIIAILIASLGPALLSSVFGLVDAMPDYINSFMEWIQESGIADHNVVLFIEKYITNLTTELETWVTNELFPLVQQYIAQITSGVFSIAKTVMNFIIGIIVMVYVMSIQETLVGQSKKVIYALFSTKRGNVIIDTVRKSNKIFGGFVTGKIIDSAIIGVIAYVGCLILQIPSPLLVAFIVGVTNVIPFFGPFIGAIPSILLVLIQSPIHSLYLAIFILILQQVDGNIIGPKILGDTTGLSAFWVLFSILIAGGIFGFFGMVLGVPVFAVIYYLSQQFVQHRMEKKNLSTDTKSYIKLVAIDENSNEMIYDDVTENMVDEK